MSSQTIKSGQWIISENGIQSFLIYKLMKGKVGIYEEGEKIASVEVKSGDNPRIMGFISALSEDGKHIASVKTESEVEVEVVNVNHIRGLLQHEVSREARDEISSMINTILMSNRIKSYKKKLSTEPVIDLNVPSGVGSELLEILSELKSLYTGIVKEK